MSKQLEQYQAGSMPNYPLDSWSIQYKSAAPVTDNNQAYEKNIYESNKQAPPSIVSNNANKNLSLERMLEQFDKQTKFSNQQESNQINKYVSGALSNPLQSTEVHSVSQRDKTQNQYQSLNPQTNNLTTIISQSSFNLNVLNKSYSNGDSQANYINYSKINNIDSSLDKAKYSSSIPQYESIQTVRRRNSSMSKQNIEFNVVEKKEDLKQPFQSDLLEQLRQEQKVRESMHEEKQKRSMKSPQNKDTSNILGNDYPLQENKQDKVIINYEQNNTINQPQIQEIPSYQTQLQNDQSSLPKYSPYKSYKYMSNDQSNNQQSLEGNLNTENNNKQLLSSKIQEITSTNYGNVFEKNDNKIIKNNGPIQNSNQQVQVNLVSPTFSNIPLISSSEAIANIVLQNQPSINYKTDSLNVPFQFEKSISYPSQITQDTVEYNFDYVKPFEQTQLLNSEKKIYRQNFHKETLNSRENSDNNLQQDLSINKNLDNFMNFKNSNIQIQVQPSDKSYDYLNQRVPQSINEEKKVLREVKSVEHLPLKKRFVDPSIEEEVKGWVNPIFEEFIRKNFGGGKINLDGYEEEIKRSKSLGKFTSSDNTTLVIEDKLLVLIEQQKRLIDQQNVQIQLQNEVQRSQIYLNSQMSSPNLNYQKRNFLVENNIYQNQSSYSHSKSPSKLIGNSQTNEQLQLSLQNGSTSNFINNNMSNIPTQNGIWNAFQAAQLSNSINDNHHRITSYLDANDQIVENQQINSEDLNKIEYDAENKEIYIDENNEEHFDQELQQEDFAQFNNNKYNNERTEVEVRAHLEPSSTIEEQQENQIASVKKEQITSSKYSSPQKVGQKENQDRSNSKIRYSKSMKVDQGFEENGDDEDDYNNHPQYYSENNSLQDPRESNNTSQTKQSKLQQKSDPNFSSSPEELSEREDEDQNIPDLNQNKKAHKQKDYSYNNRITEESQSINNDVSQLTALNVNLYKQSDQEKYQEDEYIPLNTDKQILATNKQEQEYMNSNSKNQNEEHQVQTIKTPQKRQSHKSEEKNQNTDGKSQTKDKNDLQEYDEVQFDEDELQQSKQVITNEENNSQISENDEEEKEFINANTATQNQQQKHIRQNKSEINQKSLSESKKLSKFQQGNAIIKKSSSSFNMNQKQESSKKSKELKLSQDPKTIQLSASNRQLKQSIDRSQSKNTKENPNFQIDISKSQRSKIHKSVSQDKNANLSLMSSSEYTNKNQKQVKKAKDQIIETKQQDKKIIFDIKGKPQQNLKNKNDKNTKEQISISQRNTSSDKANSLKVDFSKQKSLQTQSEKIQNQLSQPKSIIKNQKQDELNLILKSSGIHSSSEKNLTNSTKSPGKGQSKDKIKKNMPSFNISQITIKTPTQSQLQSPQSETLRYTINKLQEGNEEFILSKTHKQKQQEEKDKIFVFHKSSTIEPNKISITPQPLTEEQKQRNRQIQSNSPANKLQVTSSRSTTNNKSSKDTINNNSSQLNLYQKIQEKKSFEKERTSQIFSKNKLSDTNINVSSHNIYQNNNDQKQSQDIQQQTHTSQSKSPENIYQQNQSLRYQQQHQINNPQKNTTYSNQQLLLSQNSKSSDSNQLKNQHEVQDYKQKQKDELEKITSMIEQEEEEYQKLVQSKSGMDTSKTLQKSAKYLSPTESSKSKGNQLKKIFVNEPKIVSKDFKSNQTLYNMNSSKSNNFSTQEDNQSLDYQQYLYQEYIRYQRDKMIQKNIQEGLSSNQLTEKQQQFLSDLEKQENKFEFEEFMKRNKEWVIEKEKKLREQQQQHIHSEMQECTFKPQINQSAHIESQQVYAPSTKSSRLLEEQNRQKINSKQNSMNQIPSNKSIKRSQHGSRTSSFQQIQVDSRTQMNMDSNQPYMNVQQISPLQFYSIPQNYGVVNQQQDKSYTNIERQGSDELKRDIEDVLGILKNLSHSQKK